ncbi:transporter substrate-binding domain-containing protein [Aeromonas intestinalis]
MLVLSVGCGLAHASRVTPVETGTPLELVGRTQPVLHSTELGPADWAWLRRKETLTLGTYGPDFPPFRLGAESREFTGITADYLEILKRELGIKIRIRLYDNVEQAVKALKNGDVDIMTTLSPLDQFPDLLMSDPFIRSGPVLVRRTNEHGSVMETLRGLSVAYNIIDIRPKIAEALLPQATPIPFKTHMDSFSSVAFGHVDAILSDSVSAYFLVNTYYANELQVSKIFWGKEPKGDKFVVDSRNERLQNILNAVIKTGVSQEQRNNILQRWSGGGLMRPEPIVFNDNLSAWIRDHPKLRVGAAESYPPQSYFGEDGSYYGLTADLLARIQAQTGLDIEMTRFGSISDAFTALHRGEVDMLADLSSTEERRQEMNFSRTYLTMPTPWW